MTKQDLIKALESYPDDYDILVSCDTCSDPSEWALGGIQGVGLWDDECEYHSKDVDDVKDGNVIILTLRQ